MPNSKNYLTVPYAEKDAAKALGAKWDAAKKKWYVPASADLSDFSKWQTEASSHSAKTKKPKKSAPVNNTQNGVVTHAKDKEFIAYNGEQAPWL